MLAGALTVADQVLQAGDYCAAPAGMVPNITSGAPGSTFLLLASEPETSPRGGSRGRVAGRSSVHACRCTRLAAEWDQWC